MSQFSPDKSNKTLSDYINIKNVYPAGRLDKDSEGLLLLTDNGKLQHRITHPKKKMLKRYWVQVENIPTEQDLDKLRFGIELSDHRCLPADVKLIPEPSIWHRNPPIRQRKSIPTCWLDIRIKEGKNRQVRRMTAAMGFPTLRLIRYQIGSWQLKNLKPGEFTLVKDIG